MPDLKNLLADLPRDLTAEVCETILQREGLRIERICSLGHTAPADGGWYDQDEDEWVLLLAGAGRIAWPDGRSRDLQPGDHLVIPAHQRHRVSWTDPDQPTIWLAVFSPPRPAGDPPR